MHQQKRLNRSLILSNWRQGNPSRELQLNQEVKTCLNLREPQCLCGRKHLAEFLKVSSALLGLLSLQVGVSLQHSFCLLLGDVRVNFGVLEHQVNEFITDFRHV